MRWFKLLNDNGDTVGAEEYEAPSFVARLRNGVIFATDDENAAQGLVSADGSVIYQLAGKPLLNEPDVTLTAVEIYGEEYEEIISGLPDPEDEDPEIPDDPDGDGETPMTRAQLTAKVAELEAQNARFIGMLLENREDSMRASRAYSAGDLIVVDGTLYKALVRIASGAVLTVGTNVTQTTVAAEIAAVNL
ncbi:MAG: hypothetical protein IJI27_10335 [Oscillospiraceae bacterium]|nr:hypothetical protein [Oscillospiraceae bacterium]